ncbi:uncharacterized protein LOC126891191 [Diabrotica virgifera virgifera]|uniref:Uncharacterized protein n=1 Tax=Diabrotica virgifera virgifera TaxID=50390 RepID=A0ABM5L1L4_DIAVI|nr:uncharacterized protein LOC126891191 [Diabrotica virgifera virgifera]
MVVFFKYLVTVSLCVLVQSESFQLIKLNKITNEINVEVISPKQSTAVDYIKNFYLVNNCTKLYLDKVYELEMKEKCYQSLLNNLTDRNTLDRRAIQTAHQEEVRKIYAHLGTSILKLEETIQNKTEEITNVNRKYINLMIEFREQQLNISELETDVSGCNYLLDDCAKAKRQITRRNKMCHKKLFECVQNFTKPQSSPAPCLIDCDRDCQRILVN